MARFQISKILDFGPIRHGPSTIIRRGSIRNGLFSHIWGVLVDPRKIKGKQYTLVWGFHFKCALFGALGCFCGFKFACRVEVYTLFCPRNRDCGCSSSTSTWNMQRKYIPNRKGNEGITTWSNNIDIIAKIVSKMNWYRIIYLGRLSVEKRFRDIVSNTVV